MNFSSTDLAAWWGAIVATLVLLWDIYKWKTAGPQIRFSASSNRRIMGNPKFAEKVYIIFEAVNVGDRPTTITNLGLTHYKSRLQRILGHPGEHMVVPNAGLSHPLPHEVQPGAVWNGLVLQSEVEQMAKRGYLYGLLFYSNASKPKLTRVQVKRHPPRQISES